MDPQKCHRVNLYGFFLGNTHGVRHHYYEDPDSTGAEIQDKSSEDLDREFVEVVELTDSEMLWIADPCLYGKSHRIRPL